MYLCQDMLCQYMGYNSFRPIQYKQAKHYCSTSIYRYRQMEALQFPRGNYYMIVCKAGNQALRVQENDPTKFEKSKIVRTQPNPQDNNQLFMVQKVGLSDDQYQIVSCPTTLVFDEQGKQIKLKYGKQSKDQLFAIVQAPVQGMYKYYWIKTSSSGKQALSLQGTLKYTKFDSNTDSQLFRFEQVANNTVQGSCIIINSSTGKALDVPQASWKKGQRILQWEKNKRWNQRWRFVKQGKGYTIQSVLNGQTLDICEQKKQSGAKIIQWPVTGGTNQLWQPQPMGNGLYKIRSIHQGSLFLSIKHMDANNGGKLEVSNSENPTMYWRIQGPQP